MCFTQLQIFILFLLIVLLFLALLYRILYGGEAFEVIQFVLGAGADGEEGPVEFPQEPEMTFDGGFWKSPPCLICGKIVQTKCNFVELGRINQMKKRNLQRWQAQHGPGRCLAAEALGGNASQEVRELKPVSKALV